LSNRQRPSFPARLRPDASSNAQSPAASSQARPIAPGLPGRPRSADLSQPILSPPRSFPGAKLPTSPPHGLGLDSGTVRQAMVNKLAAQGIADTRVLQAMGAVERHRFVDSALVNQAYEDTSLPIGLGQTISKPNVVARMLELLMQGCEKKTWPGAGNWHRLWLSGGRAQPVGQRGLQHRTLAGIA